MTAPAIIVHELDVPAEAEWPFRTSQPTWRPRPYGPETVFDPFPAYPHDLHLVERMAKRATDRVPPLWNVELYVANREEISRSNGHSNIADQGHIDGDEHAKTGLIMLSGKRTPPHPAVTRYLVAHEYGHNVEWMLNAARGARHTHDETLAAEYAQLRGLTDAMRPGSGGRWHDGIHEIIACDFRILVLGVERAFWPHHGVPHPTQILHLDLWWQTQLEQLARTRPA